MKNPVFTVATRAYSGSFAIYQVRAPDPEIATLAITRHLTRHESPPRLVLVGIPGGKA